MAQPLEFNFGEKRVFVDRVDSQKQFSDAYENACKHKEQYSVICFYGDGGIGKSELFNTLQDNFKEKKNLSNSAYNFQTNNNLPLPYVTCDFGDSKSCNVVEFLKRLRNKLNNEQGFLFPLFELTYISYLGSSGDANNLSIVDEMHGFVGKHYWLTTALDIAAGVNNCIGIVKPLLSAINKIQKLPEQFQEKEYKEQAQDFIEEISMREDRPEELKKMLPLAFSKDLMWNCQRKLNKPLVVLLDTFEAYQNQLDDNPSEKDWLEEVITHSSNTLYVLFGRNKCNYSEIINYSLNNFDEKYTGELMKKKGVNDEEIIKEVYAITGGLPYYISICISNYNKAKADNQTPTLQLIGATTNDMNQRYYKYLSDVEKRIVEIASLLNVFSHDDLIKCCNEYFNKKHYTVESINKILSECIVKKFDNNRYMVHEIARVVFLNHAKSNKDIYYSEMLRPVINLQMDYLKNINLSIDIPTDILNNCALNIIRLSGTDEPLEEETIQSMTQLVSLYHKLGDRKSISRSITLEKMILFYYKKTLGDNKLETLNAAINLANSYRALGGKKNISIAIALILKAFDSGLKDLKMDDPLALKAVTTLSVCYSDIGDKKSLHEAVRLNEQLLKIEMKAKDLHILNTMNNLAGCYLKLRDKNSLTKARDLCFSVFEIRIKQLGLENETTLRSINNLANCYLKLGGKDNIMKAMYLSKRVLEIRRIVSSEYNPGTLKAMYTLESCYEHLENKENLEKAIELNKEIIKKEKVSSGRYSSKVVNTSEHLANCYTKVGGKENLQAAIDLLNPLYEEASKKPGINSALTLELATKIKELKKQLYE